MNPIPKKYPNYRWFLFDWTGRTITTETVLSVLWSRGTYGLDMHDWYVPTGWIIRYVWYDIEVEMSEETPL